MTDPVIVLTKETLIEQTGEIAARTRIRHVVTLRMDAVGEFRITVQHGLQQHFLLAEVHALVGIDDDAKTFSTARHAVQFGHEPSLPLDEHLHRPLEEERPIAEAIARHHQLFGHKGRIADAIVVIKREQ